ncbi:MAG: DNA-directed RNA polymerase subunit beta' [Candidatus Yonathbacteria bacterium]|nr:DNA-directed RNA polymerase subunit beta' [Candidatus Yonathbacteria bacterium]NTW47793.1 DNA-directed RNA polymerase subunit beta' [Candidatus Yonathbacteria bacterium]
MTTYHNHDSAEFNDFDAIAIKLASPDRIKEWSYGEITKPETINYRTGRSERGGLFDERIFGPEKDYECYCGKYRRIRYKGIVCEKCGVEVTKAIVRRERMGHIELASPVAHIWFLRGIPSRLALLLDISSQDLEKVVYFAGYIVTKVHEEERANILRDIDSEYKTKMKTLSTDAEKEKLKESLQDTKREIQSIGQGLVVDESQYHRYSLRYGTMFEARIGAEALHDICADIDLPTMEQELVARLDSAPAGEKPKLNKRIALLRSMIRSGIRPEWMFLSAIPVIPPGLRPMVGLEGGRYATSDVNDLYRRVINRNNRLKKLKEIGAPDVILRNEKRILQEAVDALLDNSMRRETQSGGLGLQRRALKSIADSLKGKQGYFRQNLLGKRVDYSGRSVIVVGSNLKLSQCGLPKKMALELFRPFVIGKLLERELAYNIRGANRLIEEGIPEVWAILEEVIKDKHVLLNRAPTLHRLGIQAFRPILIEGNAIQVHPLVCTAFNADFDGDQMAVHVPLSDEAQREARELMASNKNLLGPGNGEPITKPSQDIVLGCYWMTKDVDGETGEGKFFPSPNSAITAYDFGIVGFRSKIKVLGSEHPKYAVFEGKAFETTVGRLLFNSVLPNDFPYTNEKIGKKELSRIIDALIVKYGIDATPDILDKIKAFGFKYATHSGASLSIRDIRVPEGKKALVDTARKEVDEVNEQFAEGLLSREERYRKVIEIWQGVRNAVEKLIPQTLDKDGSVNDMITSGARGTISQVTQMAGMKGIITNTSGEAIDFPIIPSNKEGLSPLEYFITTHGSRKGLADTALQTAKAGYLTRRLVYVADNVIVTEDDCGTKEGRVIRRMNVSGFAVALAKNIRGRVLAQDVKDAQGNTLYKRGTLLGKEEAQAIEDAGVEEVVVRSPLSCNAEHGVCKKCYGVDLGRNMLVEMGEPVGIVAAQAIGEPGTQLTMRTFHAGGIATAGGDITAGLPRVEEVFERRLPKSKAVVATADGLVSDIKKEGKEYVIVVTSEKSASAKAGGDVEYPVPFRRTPLVSIGEKVEKGQLLTDGSAHLPELFKYAGAERAQEYIIDEIEKIYDLQGATISRKHIEVIVSQMFSRYKIKDPGNTTFVAGQVVERGELIAANRQMKDEGKEEAKASQLVLGITEVSLTAKSFLSAASFQHTSRVLIDVAVRGGKDHLKGLKENVIIGRLIPAGTGWNLSQGESKDTSTPDLEN